MDDEKNILHTNDQDEEVNKKEEIKDEHIIYKENYEQELLVEISEIEKKIQLDDKIFEKEVEDYFSYVLNIHQEAFYNYKKLEEKLLSLNCLKDQLCDENEELFRLIQENKDELNQIKVEKSQFKATNNVQGLEEMYRVSPIEFINSLLSKEDLTAHPKFKRLIRPEIAEALVCLKSDGGKYLKGFGTTIYFIDLLRKRYTNTVVEDQVVKEDQKNQIDAEMKKDFQNQVRVSFFKDDKIEYFLISLKTKDKKDNYTFSDLKQEACDYWGISLDERKKYHIVNEKMVVYAPQRNVYEIHKVAINNSITALNYMPMELIDRMSMFTERKTRQKVESGMKSILNEENIFNQSKGKVTEEAIFETELEDYLSFIRRIETIIDMFTKDDIPQRPEPPPKPVIDPNDENAVEEEVDEEAEEEKKIEQEKQYQKVLEQWRKKKLIEAPLYVTLYDIHLFRLAKFFLFVISIIFTYSTFYYLTNRSFVNVTQKAQMSAVFSNVLIFNSLYKEILQKESAFMRKDINTIISTKRDFIGYVNVMINNLVFPINVSKEEKLKGVDLYNGYFVSPFTVYENMNCVRLLSVSSKENRNKSDTNSIPLPNYVLDQIDLTNEYSYYSYDDKDRSLLLRNEKYNDVIRNLDQLKGLYQCDPPPYTKPEDWVCYLIQDIYKLLDYENYICNNCISNQQIVYSSSDGEKYKLETSGLISDYQEGGFYLFVNPGLFLRSESFLLFKMIQDSLILDRSNRMFLISINAIHNYFKSVVRFNILTEFSISGIINVSIESEVIDVGLNKNSSFYAVFYIMLICSGILLILLLIEILTKYRLRRFKSLGSFIMIYDMVFLSIMAFFIFSTFQTQITRDQYYKKYFVRDWNKSATEQNNTNIYEYTDLSEIDSLDHNFKILGSITILLLSFRMVFYVCASPIIKFNIHLCYVCFIRIFNIFCILVIFIFSFSLIFHTIIGKRVEVWSSFTNSLIITITNILGSLNTGTFDRLTIPQSAIIICFLIFIKFILFTFVQGTNQESYEELRSQFSNFQKLEHFKVVGETIYLFMKYLIFPINIIFIIKDFFYYKALYGSTDFKTIIQDSDLKGIDYFK